jgi:hypothetical protein
LMALLRSRPGVTPNAARGSNSPANAANDHKAVIRMNAVVFIECVFGDSIEVCMCRVAISKFVVRYRWL